MGCGRESGVLSCTFRNGRDLDAKERKQRTSDDTEFKHLPEGTAEGFR